VSFLSTQRGEALAAFEYPHTDAIPSLRPYCEEFGGTKFVWGSDLPSLERWCTYK
jgi:hypothetical protein